VLGQGIAVAAGAGLLGSRAVSADEALTACAGSHAIDGSLTPFGAVRLVLGGGSEKTLAVPVRVTAPDGIAELDVSGRQPTIRFGRPAKEVVLTAKGVRLQRGAPEEPWGVPTVRRLLAAIKGDPELQRAVLSLRTALHTAYPQYLALSRHGAPSKLGAYYAKSNAGIAKFGKPAGTSSCQTTTIVETVTTEVSHEVDVILTAIQQADRCLKDCEDRYGKPFTAGFKPIEYGFCAVGCAVDGFVDLVVGTAEIVETIAEVVVREVVVCLLSPRPGFFPNPFELGVFPGLAQPGGGARATDIDTGDVKKALAILQEVLDLGEPILDCLLAGEWTVTKLSDLRVNVDGIAEIPFGVTVCLNRACVDTMSPFTVGPKALTLLIKIATAADRNAIGAALAAAGVTGAAAVAAADACMLILGLLIILLAHLLIVMGQIAILAAAGLINNGICLTHPSLPVAVAAALNPILGIVALGNTPLVVTPR
jgi:hypothetical protein